MENIADKYYKRGIETDEPASELLNFYCAIYNKHINRTDLAMFKELVKMFGRIRVYAGLIELSLYYSHIQDGRALSKLLRRIVAEMTKREQKASSIYSPDLSEQVEKEIEIKDALVPLSELSIPCPFEEEDDGE
jgi:hypothetical protein